MKTILLDFDGVIHSYTSGWQGADVISDPPVKGAQEFLRSVIHDDEYDVCIYSSRSRQKGGIEAMKYWLNQHLLNYAEIEAISFPVVKPAAFITVDDRAICFDGDFNSLKEKIENFKPWNKKDQEEV